MTSEDILGEQIKAGVKLNIDTDNRQETFLPSNIQTDKSIT